VVGVNEKKGSVFGNSQDEFVVVPLSAYQRLFGSRRSLELTVKPVSPDLLEEAMDEARVALRVSRHLRPRDDDNFGMLTSDTLMDFWRTFSRGVFAVLIGVVSLSLVVGGVVIMNIMLMVVSERTREIGLRKALGARRRDIVWQVLTESTTLSVVGGLVGTLLGFGLAMIVAAVSPLPADDRALVDPARPRHDGDRRCLLRIVPGPAGGATRSDRGAAAGMMTGQCRMRSAECGTTAKESP
jgi:putative ABC transport system permease protein